MEGSIKYSGEWKEKWLGLKGDTFGQLLMVLNGFPALESGNKWMKQGKREAFELCLAIVAFSLLIFLNSLITTWVTVGAVGT